MEIVVNGEPRTISPMSVAELLDLLGIDPRRIALERNQDIVPKTEYATTPLAEGDRVEIVQFVGGGCR